MTPPNCGRLDGVDVARGAALVGMIVYHTVWDLHDLGFSTLDPGQSLPWRILGHAVAATFLFLSGFSLVLARRRGATMPDAMRRIAVVGLAGLAVTVVTSRVAPGQAVVFGILQCIALGNLLSLPFLAAPGWAAAAAGLVVLTAPAALPADAVPKLWWLGLSQAVPDTLDAWPLMPWGGMILLGVAFGSVSAAPARGPPPIRGPVRTTLSTIGRHSLMLYLLHQPLVFGTLWIAADLIHGPGAPAGPARDFTARCTDACVAQDTDPERCLALCRCVQARLTDDPRAALPHSLPLYARACLDDPPPASGPSAAPP